MTNQAGDAAQRRFRPYPEYRDSGIEWLGEIPAHWDVKRLKTMASVRLSNVDKHSEAGQVPVKLCNYVDVYYNEFITGELDFMNATATREQVRRFVLQAGDVLITKDSESWNDIAVPALVAEDLPDALCGYHLAHIKPGPGLDGRFLARQFSAIGMRDQFHVAANGITRFGLGGDAIRSGIFPIAPIDEQRAIAAFLGRETAKIDGLVDRKERLIELLQEKRAALITRAVSRGLDPNVPLKDSGVEWLGEIPAHWKVRPLKRVSPQITVGVVVNPSSYVQADGVPFLYGSDIQEGRIVADVARRMSEEDSKMLSKSCLRAGDLVCVRVGAPGITAVVPPELAGANCASVVIVRHADCFDSQWLCYVMNSRLVRHQVEVVQYGAAQEQFNVAHAVEFLVPWISQAEERAIAAFLDFETAKIDALIARVQAAIGWLREFRTSLISATVTGKIDVRETTQ